MKIELDLTFDLETGDLVLVNQHGYTYTTKSEEMIDFLDREITESLISPTT